MPNGLILGAPRPALGLPRRGAAARAFPAPFIAGGQGVAPPAPPVTLYTNPGGQGDRQALVTLTLTAAALDALSSGPGKLFDGNLTASSAGSIEPLGTVNAGEGLRIDWGRRMVITELTLTYGIVPNNGAWVVNVSNDLANFLQPGAFTWNQSSQVVPLAGHDVIAGYRFYDLVCPAGHSVTNDWFVEITCKIAYGI